MCIYNVERQTEDTREKKYHAFLEQLREMLIKEKKSKNEIGIHLIIQFIPSFFPSDLRKKEFGKHDWES